MFSSCPFLLFKCQILSIVTCSSIFDTNTRSFKASRCPTYRYFNSFFVVCHITVYSEFNQLFNHSKLDSIKVDHRVYPHPFLFVLRKFPKKYVTRHVHFMFKFCFHPRKSCFFKCKTFSLYVHAFFMLDF